MPSVSPTPCLPLPEPLRGAEIGSFAYRTITGRFPNIASRTMDENRPPLAARPLPPESLARIDALIAEIPAAPLRPIRDPHAPDSAAWEGWIAPYAGQDWLQVPWLVAETYFYRRILEATGFFQPGPGQGLDPFALQKRQALEGCAGALAGLEQVLSAWVDPAGSPDPASALARLFHLDLWGNQADLSMTAFWRGEARLGYQDVGAQASQLLVDDTMPVVEYLLGLPRPGRIDFIPDNVGLELVFDLLLADALLRSGLAAEVRFQLKAHPTFVSDAVIPDLLATLDYFAGRARPQVRRLGERLQSALAQGRLRLVEHFYWTSPLPAWQMPPDLRQALGGSALLVSKGDANYRRLLGDLRWPYTTPFSEIVCYLPAPLVALRVLKAELAAGLRPGQAEAAAAQDPEWLFSGQWGVIQFAPSTGTSPGPARP